jgi:two-component system sensor histidine kinase YesM
VVSSAAGAALHFPLMVYRVLPFNGWKVVGIVTTRALMSNIRTIGLMTVLLILSIALLALLVSWRLSASVTEPIREMMSLMKRVEQGELAVSMKASPLAEIGQLSKSFNIMVGRIKSLMDEVYQEQRTLRKAELAALQAQINPHFMYNTLDSIIWLSRHSRNQEVIEMVTALTRLFRLGINKGRDLITVEQEVEHVRSYLTIQSLRYRDKFDYALDVEPAVRNLWTLKLILQPLAENAIYHGVKMKRTRGSIRIGVHEDGQAVVFGVRDDGPGMKEDSLQALLDSLSGGKGARPQGFGLKNVDERIRLYFGPEYGVAVSSIDKEGTEVRIRIPKIREDTDVEGRIGGR